ncbi:MAG TPA: 2OG-Fe(II) oxygenase [Burkholderiaceae bacterium]|nr:2OG-Fe(II) oxygenase [Burkholderiaceae bacterium]
MSSSTQFVTPELREWIVAQAQAGHSPDSVLQAMRSSGWNEEVAVNALEDTLRDYLAEHARENNLPVPTTVPEPDLRQSPTVVFAHDREVRVLMTMLAPRVVVFGGLLSHEECDELIALSRQRLARSETVDNNTGGSEVNAVRTSEGMFFQRAENPLCARIEERISALVNWPVENGEGVQILRYGVGAEYRPHHDYFDPTQPGTPTILKRGGQRVGTVVMYLNTPVKGGATVFPDVHLEVAAVKGNAVFFSYDRPHPITRTLHGGSPVIEGEKWVATKWMRQGRFD